jgi:hypothetical protein
VVSLIKNARNDLSLKLIQPVEKPTQPSKVLILNWSSSSTPQFILLFFLNRVIFPPFKL